MNCIPLKSLVAVAFLALGWTPVSADVTTFDSSSICSWNSDATSALQDAINTAVGGQLVIPSSAEPCVVTGLWVPGNSHLTIDGTLYLMDGANASVLSIVTNADSVVIDGSGFIDGNRWNQDTTGCAAAKGCGGITSLKGSNISVSGLKIANMVNWPVNLVTISGATMSNMVLMDSGSSVEFASGTHDCSANNLTVSGIDDEGFAFYGGVYNCSISNSTVSGSSADGFSVLSDAAQRAPSHDILISSVEAYGNAVSGASVVNGIGASGTHFNITIKDSYFHENNRGNFGGRGGIFVNNATNVTLSNSQIDHDGNGSSAAYGIYFGPAAADSLVDGMTIFDEGQGGTLGVGVNLSGATNITVKNSSIYDDQGNKTMAYDINGSSAPGFTQYGNTLSPSIGAVLH